MIEKWVNKCHFLFLMKFKLLLNVFSSWNVFGLKFYIPRPIDWNCHKIQPLAFNWDIPINSTRCNFSSPEPKAQVGYCHSEPSVVRPAVNCSHFWLLQNRLMDFDETWYGWGTHDPLQVLLFFGQIRPLADPGRAKIGHGVPFFKELILQTGRQQLQNRCIAVI